VSTITPAEAGCSAHDSVKPRGSLPKDLSGAGLGGDHPTKTKREEERILYVGEGLPRRDQNRRRRVEFNGEKKRRRQFRQRQRTAQTYGLLGLCGKNTEEEGVKELICTVLRAYTGQPSIGPNPP